MSGSAPSIPNTSRYGGATLSSLSPEALASLASMEGIYDRIVEAKPAAAKPRAHEKLWIGYAASAVVSAVAFGVHYLPIPPFQLSDGEGVRRPVSAALLAILIGLLARNAFTLPTSISNGCKQIVRKIIPISIVLTGVSLNLNHIAKVGPSAIAIIVLTMTVAIASAYYAGRSLGLGWRAALLIGAGTGICGNSAIVAVAPLVDAEDDDLVVSIGTINLFGLVAMLACPAIAGLVHMEAIPFGVWAGTSIHAVPQVMAAASEFGKDAGTVATLVKLVRVALLAPLVFVLAMIYAKHHAGEKGNGGVIVHYARLVPWFVWGFVIMAVLSTLGVVPTSVVITSSTWEWAPNPVKLLTDAAQILLTLAMAAIGLEVNIRLLAGVSGPAVLTGLVSTAALMAAGFGLVLILL